MQAAKIKFSVVYEIGVTRLLIRICHIARDTVTSSECIIPVTFVRTPIASASKRTK